MKKLLVGLLVALFSQVAIAKDVCKGVGADQCGKAKTKGKCEWQNDACVKVGAKKTAKAAPKKAAPAAEKPAAAPAEAAPAEAMPADEGEDLEDM
jgi:hypothetical protein